MVVDCQQGLDCLQVALLLKNRLNNKRDLAQKEELKSCSYKKKIRQHSKSCVLQLFSTLPKTLPVNIIPLCHYH